MMLFPLIMTVLPFLSPFMATSEVGLASRYGYPGDRYEPKNKAPACQSRLWSTWGKKRWQKAFSIGVAHRTLPCGTKIQICRVHPEKATALKISNQWMQESCTTAIVVDRGPYGALDKQGKWHVRKHLRPKERWRGIVDLRPEVAKSLNVRGLEWVTILY